MGNWRVWPRDPEILDTFSHCLVVLEKGPAGRLPLAVSLGPDSVVRSHDGKCNIDRPKKQHLWMSIVDDDALRVTVVTKYANVLYRWKMKHLRMNLLLGLAVSFQIGRAHV